MTPEEMFALVNGQLNTALQGVSLTGAVNQAVATGVKTGDIPILTADQAKKKLFLQDLTTGGLGNGTFADIARPIVKAGSEVAKNIPIYGQVITIASSVSTEVAKEQNAGGPGFPTRGTPQADVPLLNQAPSSMDGSQAAPRRRRSFDWVEAFGY